MVKDTELAILFADVVGSTRLFEVLGDARARDMVTTCIDIMREATQYFRGTVIKTMGDEVLSTFADANDAMDAAARMQRGIGSHASLQVEGQPVMIRIGCHFGPVVLENRDVFGAAVHTANRMTSQAKAGQIIVTDAVFERLSDSWKDSCRHIDIAVPRGQHDEVMLYEVLWQPEGGTTSMLRTIDVSQHARPVRLKVSYQGQEQVLDTRVHSSIRIGRGDDNDLVVRGNLVSRVHARIEATKNRFVLVDQSTNGSFVVADDGNEAFVRRDSLPLTGSGKIGFGRVPETDSFHTIEFAYIDS